MSRNRNRNKQANNKQRRGRKTNHRKRTYDHNAKRAQDSRVLDGRETQKRFAPFRINGLLAAPPARPGFVQKWLTWKIHGEQVDRYFINLRDGWQARDPKTVPDLWKYPCSKYHDGSQRIIVGGMVLCEIPKERAREISDAWEKRALNYEMKKRLSQRSMFVDRRYGNLSRVDEMHDLAALVHGQQERMSSSHLFD